jgi:hypothetical protein
MSALISNLDKFTVQLFMKQNPHEIEKRSIAESSRYIKRITGVKVSPSTLRGWGKMLHIDFCKSRTNRQSQAYRERSKLRTQVKTLAVVIREICEDLGMLQHPGITEIIEIYAKNNVKRRP